METIKFSEQLHNMYLQSLKDIELASEVLIEDEDNADQSVELLLLDAMYGVACFSRAVRGTRTAPVLQEKVNDLKNNLNQTVELMSGDGAARLKKFLLEFFDISRVEEKINLLNDRFKAACKSNEFHMVVEDEDVEDQVFDYLLFIDHFVCLNHPEDCPVRGLESILSASKDGIDYIYNTLKTVLNVYSKSIETYRRRTFIPEEQAYGFWFDFQEVNVDNFVSEYENALAILSQQKVFLLLLKTFPHQLTDKIRALKIETKMSEIISKLGDQAKVVFEQIVDVVYAPEISVEPAWSCVGNEIELIRAQYGEDLQNEAARMYREFDGAEKRDVLILEYILLGDEDKVEELLIEL